MQRMKIESGKKRRWAKKQQHKSTIDVTFLDDTKTLNVYVYHYFFVSRFLSIFICLYSIFICLPYLSFSLTVPFFSSFLSYCAFLLFLSYCAFLLFLSMRFCLPFFLLYLLFISLSIYIIFSVCLTEPVSIEYSLLLSRSVFSLPLPLSFLLSLAYRFHFLDSLPRRLFLPTSIHYFFLS